MATELCQKCKQAHPGRVCDYDDKGDCVETADLSEAASKAIQESTDKKNAQGKGK